MILADTHVHLYDLFDPNACLDAALTHFDVQAAHAPDNRPPRFLLCLTDPSGMEADRRLVEEIGHAGPWCFSWAAGAATVRAERTDGRQIDLLPGRQIVSAEGLEVLALNCRLTVPDREHSVASLLDIISSGGGIPVLPWSFGKWLGRRGRVVEELFSRCPDLLLADNGNRWPERPLPKLLRRGEEQGIPVLAGSDSLPYRGQEARVGSCGIVAEDAWPDLPAEAVFSRMMAARAWSRFQGRMSLFRFAQSMVRMQIRKRI